MSTYRIFHVNLNTCDIFQLSKKVTFFCDFYFSSYRLKFIENWGHFEYKNNHNSKNKNRKKRKIVFSFISAHCVSFMKVGSKLGGGGGFAYPSLGQSRILINSKTKLRPLKLFLFVIKPNIIPVRTITSFLQLLSLK